ncbi:hypothetical protein ACIHCX_23380 [Streptomyces sp. NPDC052043]|uniref:hypothetical protein n=1 Tax=Streptomyces sp. NPDC052043 TaxID=3365684 RepID=UPI0037D6D01E
MRSTYRRQVERIAPLRLLDRESELAELAAFCLQEQRGPYVWWQAGPWAGKSGLLSTFVLTPPEPLSAGGVRLVSFFITARLASQDTREAFTTTLSQQLCALLGVDLPAGGDEAAREVALMDLFADAAAACQQAGGRLVLVVDGLDEDRGITTGPGAHSIAGLLPGRPPYGMRVVVAGRPNPPIPDDVPDWHPLRDPGIVRLLGDSPHARDLQRLGHSELKRLLKGTPVEQDLLGLLTAARGGLSGPDLRELTGADLVTVEEVLHTVAGRTFTRRLATWAPDDGPQVYLLGHEELDKAAWHYLGPDDLARYQDRLHTWAEGYRTPTDGRPPWPSHTPEYLLTGYPRMLATAGDTNRLTALAIDPARHDRMLDLTGGDTAALTEIETCQDLLLDCSQPDLYALARLSHHRGQLESRNALIPTTLPAVWATLGYPNRAEQIARAITHPGQRALALAGVVGAVAAAGDHVRARELATDTEQIAQALASPYERALALAGVAGAVAAAGDHEHAKQIAQTLTNPDQRARALAGVAGAVAAAGDHEHAEQIARTLTNPFQGARALAGVAGAVAAAGDHVRARQLATDTEQIAQALTNPYERARALVGVVGAVAAAGDHVRARELATETEQIAQALASPYERALALAGVAGAVAAAGDHEHAKQVARAIAHPDQRARALAEVAGAVAAAGDHVRARELATDTEQFARAIADPRRALALAGVAEAVAAAGDHEHAKQIVRALTNPFQRALALIGVAGAVAAAGDHEHAEQIARALTDLYERALALAGVAGAVAAAGDHVRARQLATDAERFARATITDPDRKARALTEVAGAAAAAGDHVRARQLATDTEQFARAITDPYERARALAGVAEVAAAAGDHEHAEQIARALTDPRQRGRALAEVAEAVAAAGDHEHAEQIARAITNPERRARALTEVAKVVGPSRAGCLLGEAFTLGSWLTPLPVLALLYPQEVIRIADAVYAEEASRDAQ